MREAITRLATPHFHQAFLWCLPSNPPFSLSALLLCLLAITSLVLHSRTSECCALLPSGRPCTLATPGRCPTDSLGFLRPNFQTHLHLHPSSPLSTLDPIPASVNDFPHNKFFLFLYIQKKFSSLMSLPISIEI